MEAKKTCISCNRSDIEFSKGRKQCKKCFSLLTSQNRKNRKLNGTEKPRKSKTQLIEVNKVDPISLTSFTSTSSDNLIDSNKEDIKKQTTIEIKNDINHGITHSEISENNIILDKIESRIRRLELLYNDIKLENLNIISQNQQINKIQNKIQNNTGSCNII